jgi:hypothetical protein
MLLFRGITTITPVCFFLKRSIMYIGVRGIYFASVFRILRLDFVSGRVMSCLRFFVFVCA